MADNMPYNYDKDTCDRCNITQEEFDKKYKHTGLLTYSEMCNLTSFRLGYDGSVLCANCHREKELKELFEKMDKRENHASKDRSS